MTRGNLSTHLSKLEAGGLVEIEKGYVGKIPQTVIRMTAIGRKEFLPVPEADEKRHR